MSTRRWQRRRSSAPSSAACARASSRSPSASRRPAAADRPRQDRLRRPELPRPHRGAGHRPDRTGRCSSPSSRTPSSPTGEPIVRPAGTHALDLEAELGVVIGERARRVAAADAMDARRRLRRRERRLAPATGRASSRRSVDDEHGDGQWLRAKGSDTFYPIGPIFVTADEFDGPPDLPIRSWRIPGSGPGRRHAGPDAGQPDGQHRLRHPDAHRVRQLDDHPRARATSSRPGRPTGVGVFRDPPVFLEPGDRVRIEIDGHRHGGESGRRRIGDRLTTEAAMLALVKTAPGPGPRAARGRPADDRDQRRPHPGPADGDLRDRPPHRGVGSLGGDDDLPPLVVGHEFVGEIVEVGSNVTDFRPGDLVSGEGHVVCGRCRHCLAGRRAPVRQRDRPRRGPRRRLRRVRRPADDEHLAPLAGRRSGGGRDLRPVRQRGPHRARLPGPRRGRPRQRRRTDRPDGDRGRPPRRRPVRRRLRAERLSAASSRCGWAPRSPSTRPSATSRDVWPELGMVEGFDVALEMSGNAAALRVGHRRDGPRRRRGDPRHPDRPRSRSTSTRSCSRC